MLHSHIHYLGFVDVEDALVQIIAGKPVWVLPQQLVFKYSRDVFVTRACDSVARLRPVVEWRREFEFSLPVLVLWPLPHVRVRDAPTTNQVVHDRCQIEGRVGIPNDVVAWPAQDLLSIHDVAAHGFYNRTWVLELVVGEAPIIRMEFFNFWPAERFSINNDKVENP